MPALLLLGTNELLRGVAVATVSGTFVEAETSEKDGIALAEGVVARTEEVKLSERAGWATELGTGSAGDELGCTSDVAVTELEGELCVEECVVTGLSADELWCNSTSDAGKTTLDDEALRDEECA